MSAAAAAAATNAQQPLPPTSSSSSLFTFPWTKPKPSTLPLGGSQQPPWGSSTATTAHHQMHPSTSPHPAVSAALSDWTGGHALFGPDTELVHVLSELVAAGKTLHDDVVVDHQLTQFPTYGTAAAVASSSRGDDDDDEEENEAEYTTDQAKDGGGIDAPRNRSGLDGRSSNAHGAVATTIAASTTTATANWLLSPWGLLGVSNLAGTPTMTAASTEPTNLEPNSSASKLVLTNKTNASTDPLLNWDPREQYLWKSTNAPLDVHSTESMEPTNNNNAATATFNNRHSETKQDRMDFWMPDQLCKQCHACDTPFTLFRRRHHCRLCGQVFCNACSAFFRPVTTTTAQGDPAAHWHDGTTKAANLTSTTSPVATRRTTASTSSYPPSPSNAVTTPTTTAAAAATVATTTIRVCQHCHDHASVSTISAVLNQGAPRYSEQPTFDNVAAPVDPQQQVPATPIPLVLQFKTSSTATSPIIQEQIRRLASDHLAGTVANAAVVSNQRNVLVNNRWTGDESQPTRLSGWNTNHSKDSFSRSPQPGSAIVNAELPVDGNLVQQGNAHMEKMVRQHLELMARELLRQHAPLVWNSSHLESSDSVDSKPREETGSRHDTIIKSWIDALLMLATRCCTTVNPNVKKGDLLDIRPYVKVKVVPGGSVQECAYLSGVMFRKTVSHKRMVKELMDPRIMLLSGGIEFTRTENRIASLETLFEQEDKYTEILVGKILNFQPDVLLVGRSVSRNAQELLVKAGVVLVQHVKSSLLNRIARQTGATIISSTDHITNQFGSAVLGKCRRFRLVAFRDNEIWTDQPRETVINLREESVDSTLQNVSKSVTPGQTRQQRVIEALLSDQKLSNHERQDALAAKRLGESVIDGCDAVNAGLASRGVAHTYTLLEGCPKHLGCTVVLRGATKVALKQIKAVFRFLAMSAYNLRLESTYLQERGARLRPDFKVIPLHAYSSSLAVDYGKPPDGRKVRPWNGGNTENSLPRIEPGELSAFDHQSILLTSVWMTEKTQCCPAEVKGICYYSLQDVALGQFLRDSCFNLSLKCQNPNCKKSVLDHSLSFVHNDGLINITVEEMDEPLQPPVPPKNNDENDGSDEDDATDQPIATWTYCQHCKKIVTPLTYISDLTWKFSFGKFLEVFFYNRDACLNAATHECACNLQSCATLYFGCEKLAARFSYEKVIPFGVFVRRTLPLDITFHRKEAMRRLDFISVESGNLFVNFDKHIEKISREARSLFNSAMNRPEHLQTVLSELNQIGSEVDHAAKTLQEKIATVTENCRRNTDGSLNGALFRFPLLARRYLFNLTTAWNEKLSATGQAISSMKRIAASSSHLQDGAMGPNVSASISDPLNEELSEGMKRLRQLIDYYASYNVTDINQVLPSLPGGDNVHMDADYDEDFDDPETSMDFADGIDADVVASRRRLKSSKMGQASLERPRSVGQKPTKTLGTRRATSDATKPSLDSNLPSNVPPKPTPGGAVKSAITRFFNRGGRDYDQYVVDLGKFAEGRPRLAPGVNGIVVPVVDEQLSTIIAYSLASTEYAKQFKHFSKEGGGGPLPDGVEPTHPVRRNNPKPDLDAGVGYSETVSNPTISRPTLNTPLSPTPQNAQSTGGVDEAKAIERQMLNRNKSHVKHTFRDVDEKGQVICKFVCTTYWATQFHAVRQSFLSGENGSADSALQSSQDVEQSYNESLLSAYSWAASGGKSGASFARTADDRFVIKRISRTELQMFLDCARAYFEYLCKAFFHGLPTVLCKIVGVYQIGVHNRETGKRSMEQVAVMQYIFYNKKITKIFDLKGSLRGRFAAHARSAKDESRDTLDRRNDNWQDDTASRYSSANSLVEETADSNGAKRRAPGVVVSGTPTLLDGDFLEFTLGRPMPLTDRAKAVFQMSILNDTLFLSIINVLDYSVLVGFDEENNELVVGIIDFMRQYDILKQMERVGKSLPMVVGSEAPTIIQPPLYKARFTNAMERYFMTVPSKWTTI